MGDTWYYGDAGKAVGPHTLEDIQQMIAAGKLRPNDHVCSDGQNWRRAADCPELHFPPASEALYFDYRAASEPAPVVTAHAMEMLRQTSPWVRIMSVLAFILAGLMIFLGLGLFVLAIVGARAGGPGALLGFVGCIYIPLAVLYIIPARYLWLYATYSSSFAVTRDAQTLENALQAQKSFWKFAAIFTLIAIALYVIFLGIAFLGVAGGHRF